MIMFAHGIGLLVIAALGLVIVWAAVDAAIRPNGAYDAIGHKKVHWVAGLTLAALLFWFRGLGLFGIVGVVAAIVYIVEYRPKLREITRGSRDRNRNNW